MDIGFIGLGKMGFPMARRLVEAGHPVTVFDQRREAVDKLIAKEITSHITITDADVANFYNANKASFNLGEPQIHMAQILVTPTADPNVRNLKNDKARDEEQARKKILSLSARLRQGVTDTIVLAVIAVLALLVAIHAAVARCMFGDGSYFLLHMVTTGQFWNYDPVRVIAQIIGRGVLRNRATPPHFAATLHVGLVIVIVAINLPWIGGLANLVLTLVGFGVIVSLILASLNRGSMA